MELESEFTMAYYWLGLVNYRAGHTHQAIESFLNCLKRDPESLIALYDLSIIYLTIGDNEEAIKVLQKLIKAYPNHEAAHYHLGMAFNNFNLLRRQFAGLHQDRVRCADFADVMENGGIINIIDILRRN